MDTVCLPHPLVPFGPKLTEKISVGTLPIYGETEARADVSPVQELVRWVRGKGFFLGEIVWQRLEVHQDISMVGMARGLLAHN